MKHSTFYINYEECKLRIGMRQYKDNNCFILTMRNVNIRNSKDSKITNTVLY